MGRRLVLKKTQRLVPSATTMGIEAGVEPGSGGGGENQKPDKINYGTLLAVTEFTVQAVQYHHTHDLNGMGFSNVTFSTVT